MHGDQNRLTGPAGEVHLSPRCMEVLILLARRAGEVVSREDFNDAIWETEFVTDDALTRHISELRRVLGDDARDPRYIETIPKRGYRLVADVQPLQGTSAADRPNRKSGVRDTAHTPALRTRLSLILVPALLAIAVIAIVAAFYSPRPTPDREEPVIAVLPFEAFGAETALPLVDGLHHDLLTRLSGIERLRVISRTSVKRYRDSVQPIPEIAAQLGADWILEGAVQQAGNEIQLNAQLIEARSDSHLWARTYRRELTAENLFTIQAEIVDDITGALQTHLTADEHNRIVRVPTRNLAAYELVIQGNVLLPQRTEWTLQRAAEVFQQAIDADPEYADAWAYRAYAEILLVYYGYADPDDSRPQARANVLTALELDPELALAHVVQGVIYMHIDNDGPAAIDAFERAHEISSEYTGWYSWMRAVAGDLEHAVELMQQTVRRNPLSAAANMSMAFLYLADRQTEAALVQTRKARELSPGFATAWLLEGQALLVENRAEQAVEAIEQGLELASPDLAGRYLGWLAAAYAQAGDIARANELTEQIEAEDSLFSLGIARLGLGDSEAAIDALSQGRRNDNQTIMLRYHPFFDPMRHDPVFSELIRQLDRQWGVESNNTGT